MAHLFGVWCHRTCSGYDECCSGNHPTRGTGEGSIQPMGAHNRPHDQDLRVAVWITTIGFIALAIAAFIHPGNGPLGSTESVANTHPGIAATPNVPKPAPTVSARPDDVHPTAPTHQHASERKTGAHNTHTWHTNHGTNHSTHAKHSHSSPHHTHQHVKHRHHHRHHHHS